MEKKEKLHLLWRSGFGPDVSSLDMLDSLTAEELWVKIKNKANISLRPLQASTSFVQDNYDKITDRSLTRQEKENWDKRIKFQSAADLKELNTDWIKSMVSGENQLGEKMSFFWHHHFSIRHPNSFLQQDAINIIRQHSLGNFGDLLREVSKSGAMILSLNNQQNKRTAPNENFAREIMELFSMGIGSYSEKDIKEAARAFTGWSISREGRFVFKREQHDSGTKVVLGERGNFDGDDIVDIILKQPQTARFIATKLYRFLVNDWIDESRVEKLASSFRKDYEIMSLLDNIFTSKWFYETKNIGGKIKTPVELLVGTQRLSPFGTVDPKVQLSIQKLLGQVLFHPPSIAGWPINKNWIDSSTLMVRLQLPQVLSGKMSLQLKSKSNDDVNMGRANQDDDVRVENQKNYPRNKTWENWADRKENRELVAGSILVDLPSDKLMLLQTKFPDKREFMFGLMSFPEYQLC